MAMRSARAGLCLLVACGEAAPVQQVEAEPAALPSGQRVRTRPAPPAIPSPGEAGWDPCADAKREYEGRKQGGGRPGLRSKMKRCVGAEAIEACKATPVPLPGEMKFDEEAARRACDEAAQALGCEYESLVAPAVAYCVYEATNPGNDPRGKPRLELSYRPKHASLFWVFAWLENKDGGGFTETLAGVNAKTGAWEGSWGWGESPGLD